MNNKLRLTENIIVKKILKLLKEDEVEKVYITPEDYIQYLRQVGFMAHAIPYLPQFRDKKLVVKGDLDVSKIDGKQRIYKLGNIEVTGNLNVSNTGIKSLDDVIVGGYKTFWRTPYEQVVERRKQKAKYDEQNEKRKDNEWDPNDTDREGEMANAAFEYAVNNGNLETLTDDEKERIREIEEEIQSLEEQQENLDSGDENYSEKFDEITDKQSELEEERDELLSDRVDVYDLYPSGSHYELNEFESLSTKQRYAAGTYSDADSSLETYYGEMVDDASNYFDNNYLSNYIDEDRVKEYFRNTVEEWVREEPDSYGVGKELSRSQEDEIWLLEMERWVYENEGVRAPIRYPTKEKDGTFDFMDAEDNNLQYRRNGNNWVLYNDEGQVVPPHQLYDDENTEEHDEERESRISDIEYEIEEIKDHPDGDPDEDEIERAVESYLDDEIGYDVSRWLTNMGYDISDWIDTGELLDDLVRNGEYGQLNSYDNDYDTININGTDYVVMRLD